MLLIFVQKGHLKWELNLLFIVTGIDLLQKSRWYHLKIAPDFIKCLLLF